MRYFIIFYEMRIVVNSGSYSNFGNVSQILPKYPSRTEIEESLSPNKNTTINITNIIELNQSDFESWNR